MVLNQEPKMEDEKIPQYVQENPIMVEEYVNPSCFSFFFLVDVDEAHYLLEALNSEIQNIGKRPWIPSFNLYKTIALGYLFLFHLVTNQ
jgi:hypothetical protein